MTVTKSPLTRFTFPIVAGIVYAIALRLIFHGTYWGWKEINPASSPLYPTDLWVLTIGFLVFVPFAIGWICVAASETNEPRGWGTWITLPWLPILVSNVFMALLSLEGLICIIFAIPITLFFGSFGGIAAGLWSRHLRRTGQRSISLCLAVLPILIAAVEMGSKSPMQIRTVQTSILIHAPALTVWHNVERVPAIQPSELQTTWVQRIGFPRPIEATLDHEGIGGVRHASFAGGLLFIETVTDWEPNERLAFTIKANTDQIPPTTLDQHVTIGGRYFDVLRGEYRVEGLADGDILLHLSSQERLSTDLNPYVGLWSDAVMRNIQKNILQVVKHRCEAQTLADGIPAPPSATLTP